MSSKSSVGPACGARWRKGRLGGLSLGCQSRERATRKPPARTACSANTPKCTPLGTLTFLWNSDSESWRPGSAPASRPGSDRRSRRGRGACPGELERGGLGGGGWPPPASGKRQQSAVCLADCLVGRETRGPPAEEVRVTSQAGAPGAGGLPADCLPAPPGSSSRWPLDSGGAVARPVPSRTLALSKGTDQGAYCWLVGLEEGRGAARSSKDSGVKTGMGVSDVEAGSPGGCTK